METTETREQTLKKIAHYEPLLSDFQLRLAAAFMRGLCKGGESREQNSK